MRAMSFLYPSKTKLIVYIALLMYFSLAALWFTHPFLPHESPLVDIIFVPALYTMITIGSLFDLQRFMMEGKGPPYSQTEIHLSYAEAMMFGVVMLYIIACIVGSGIERHRSRLKAQIK